MKSMKVKILQWNIWYKENPDNILDVIRTIDPDIFCLQELTINSKWTDYRDVPKYIAEKTGTYSSYYSAHTNKEGWSIGNGVFSKYPIMELSNFFVQEGVAGSVDYSEEGRICVEARIIFPDSNYLDVATTHLSYTHAFEMNPKKVLEVDNLLEFIKTKKNYFLLAGDLNLTPESFLIQQIWRYLWSCWPEFEQPTWTTKPFSYHWFEATECLWRLDYLFATKDIRVLHSEIIDTEYSDHLPVLIEIELPDKLTAIEVNTKDIKI